MTDLPYCYYSDLHGGRPPLAAALIHFHGRVEHDDERPMCALHMNGIAMVAPSSIQEVSFLPVCHLSVGPHDGEHPRPASVFADNVFMCPACFAVCNLPPNVFVMQL